jgi:hypothetical protein
MLILFYIFFRTAQIHALATLCHIKCFASRSTPACMSGISDVVEYHHIVYAANDLALHFMHTTSL